MIARVGRAAVFLLVALAAPVARAQDPATPPPAAGEGSTGAATPHELLPDIGRIGAQVGLAGGASWNPYEGGRGFALGGYLDLPLARVAAGRLSYEVVLQMSDAESDPFVITDAVAYVANLASGADAQAALAGPPAAPFPVRREVRTRMKVLQISPFGLRYTVTRLDRARLRPYVAGGLDLLVVLTREDPTSNESLAFNGMAPFDGPLLGGQVAQAPELTARGRPTGQGNLEWGAHAGAGVEVRLARGVSLNLDYRLTGVGGSAQRLQVAGTSLGIHW